MCRGLFNWWWVPPTTFLGDQLMHIDLVTGAVAARGLRHSVSAGAYEVVSSWMVFVAVATFVPASTCERDNDDKIRFSFPLEWLVDIVERYDPSDRYDMVDPSGVQVPNPTYRLEDALSEPDFIAFRNWFAALRVMMLEVELRTGVRFTVSWLAQALSREALEV